MSERPVPAPVAVKRCLLPDLDGELFARSEPLDELLLSLAEWADEEPDEVPAALHRPASDALGEVRIALNAAPYRAVFAPDGRYEHLPLAVVELPRVTIEPVRPGRCRAGTGGAWRHSGRRGGG